MRFFLKLLLKLLYISGISVISIGIGLGLYTTTLLPDLPTVEEIREIPLNIPLRIYSADNRLIAEYGNERRIPLTLDETPPLLIDALLATEDDRFYHHTGVDFPGLVRATISNVVTGSRGQGASTITMQVARNFFLNPEKTYTRKLKEILLAFNMERALSKDEILELYLNKIFLGHRAYGFAAAAKVYYGDDLENLSIPEIAMLAGLPKAPSRDNPLSNPTRAKERRAHVLNRLHELGRIDDFSFDNAKKSPVTARRHVADVDLRAPFVSEMARQIIFERFGRKAYELGLNVKLTVNSDYQDKANQALRKGLLDYDTRHGYRGVLGNVDISTANQEDRTQIIAAALQSWPVSQDIQPAVVISATDKGFSAIIWEDIEISVALDDMAWARKYIGPNSKDKKITSAGQVVAPGDIVYVREVEAGIFALSQIPEVSGALVSLNPDTGAILALTGGFDYFLSKFNRATQAKRQPGSNIKPFIYSAALANGFTPSSLVSAAPIIIEDGFGDIWRPENYSKKFFGPTRLRKALSLSLNLVSVRLLRAVGMERAINHLEKIGFDKSILSRNLSLSLGAIEITPLDLAGNFSAIANGGKRVTPYLIASITDSTGKEVALPEHPCDPCDGEAGVSPGTEPGEAVSADGASAQPQQPAQQTERVIGEISAQNAFLTTSMMKQVIVSGTGQRALALGRSDLAGKTGTTDDFKDAWFSGFSPDVMTTVYVGFDEPSHLGRRESGASAALPIWVDFMGHVLKDFPERQERIPSGITTRFINKDTARATYAGDPDGYTEYYLAGTEPANQAVLPLEEGDNTSPTQSESVAESLF